MSATNPEPIRELAAGYALGALTKEEAAAFEAAMAQSPELAREVAEYREVNALLGHAAAEQPGAAVRDRLLQRVSQGKVAPIRSKRGWLAPVLGGLAAGLAFWAVSLNQKLGVLTGQLNGKDARLAAAEAQLAKRELTLNTLLEAEAELTVVQLTTSGERSPGVQLFWNRRSNVGVLHAFRLPPTAKGKVYQLWLLRGGKPYPSMTFNSEGDGHALVQAFPLPEGGAFEAAAVTVEPEGGSTTPTMPIILVGKV